MVFTELFFHMTLLDLDIITRWGLLDMDNKLCDMLQAVPPHSQYMSRFEVNVYLGLSIVIKTFYSKYLNYFDVHYHRYLVIIKSS